MADKIERFREVLTMRITPAQFDALVAAVREDERQKWAKEKAAMRQKAIEDSFRGSGYGEMGQ